MIRRKTWTTLTFLGVLAAAAGAWRLQDSGGPQDLPPVPATPAPGWDLVWARPFTTAEPFTHWWRAERPDVDAGWLVVLTAEPTMLVPRETAEPVLYVGDQTAERFNKGFPDGALVAIVPSERGEDGGPRLDLASAPIWFGDPALPERIDAAAILAARESASNAGITPFAAARVETARRAGGDLLELADREALEREAARVVLRFAPGELDFANGKLVGDE